MVRKRSEYSRRARTNVAPAGGRLTCRLSERLVAEVLHRPTANGLLHSRCSMAVANRAGQG